MVSAPTRFVLPVVVIHVFLIYLPRLHAESIHSLRRSVRKLRRRFFFEISTDPISRREIMEYLREKYTPDQIKFDLLPQIVLYYSRSKYNQISLKFDM